jgi:cytochrome b involved in lipid metabolism
MKKLVLAAALASAAGCAAWNGPSSRYTPGQIAAHNTEKDCWIVLHGQVYDVSAFIPEHPGGRAILQACGRDGTRLFETRPMGSGQPHSSFARERARELRIGALTAGGK